MNGDRDVVHVSKSANLRTSPSAYRKCAKGCSPSNLPVCKSSLFSSKGQSMYSGRRGSRSSISETLLLPAGSERKRVVGGKTSTKRSAVLTFSTPEIAVPDGDQLDSTSKPESPEEAMEKSKGPKSPEQDMEKSKGCSLSDDDLHEHVPDSLRQPSCSEKVSKWLEESQHSAITDLSDNRSVSPDEDLEVNRTDECHELIGREVCGNGTRISDTEVFDTMKRPMDNVPGIISTAQPLDYVPVDKFKGFNGLSLAGHIIMGYLKVLMCLSVLCLGFLLRIRPTSWENYEPPPT